MFKIKLQEKEKNQLKIEHEKYQLLNYYKVNCGIQINF